MLGPPWSEQSHQSEQALCAIYRRCSAKSIWGNAFHHTRRQKWLLAGKAWWREQSTLHLQNPMGKIQMDTLTVWATMQRRHLSRENGRSFQPRTRRHRHSRRHIYLRQNRRRSRWPPYWLLGARRNNIRFNPEKFQFKVAEASFFGMKWTPNGLKVDDKKIQAIVNMEPPKDIKEL